MTHHIRFSTLYDFDALQDFIHNHWREHHILSQDKIFLQWQYQSGQTSGFVIAENSDGQIDAILGFILPEFFQTQQSLEEIKGCRLWLAIWKVKETCEKSLLGIQLFMFLKSKLRPREISAIGINEQVAKLYRSLKFNTGYMYQGIIVNHALSEYMICSNIPKDHLTKKEPQFIYEIKNEEAPLYDLISQCIYASRKSRDYYQQRFIQHPYYRYLFLNIYHNSQAVGSLIGRVCEFQGQQVLRIVDFIMPKIFDVSFQLHDFIQKNNYEYIDMVCSDLDVIIAMGFKQVKDNMIAPHYFEPFEKKSIILQYAYHGSDNFFAVKADSDQDRPNLC